MAVCVHQKLELNVFHHVFFRVFQFYFLLDQPLNHLALLVIGKLVDAEDWRVVQFLNRFLSLVMFNFEKVKSILNFRSKNSYSTIVTSQTNKK